MSDGGCRLNRTVFEVNNMKFDIKTRDNYMIVNCNFESNKINTDYYLVIVEALSVITGELINPILVKHSYKSGNITKIINVKKNPSRKKSLSSYPQFVICGYGIVY